MKLKAGIRVLEGAGYQAWDAYVDRHPLASPYHRMAWGTAVRQAYRHEPVYFVAEAGGEVCGVMPCIRMSAPLGKTSLCSLPFCDVGSCLADDKETEQALVQAARRYAADRQISFLHTRSRLNVAYSGVSDGVGKVSMLLDLPGSSDELFSGFKSKLRSQVRKARKNGLSFELANSPAGIRRFYRVFSENMRDLGSPVHSVGWFDALLNGYGNSMAVGIVSFESRPVGAGVLLFSGKMAAIPWASTLARHNQLAPNMLLYWEMLKTSVERGCKTFDFGRSTYGEGTYRFKKQWGAEPVPLVWETVNTDGAVLKDSAESGISRRVAAAAWRRLPLVVANRLGPRLRRFISL